MITLKGISVAESFKKTKNSTLIFGLFESASYSKDFKDIDSELSGSLSKALEIDNFSGKNKEIVTVFGNNIYSRIIVIGLGEKDKYKGDLVRSIGSRVMSVCNSNKLKNVNVSGGSMLLSNKNNLQSFCEGLGLGSYEFLDYKSDKSKSKVAVSVKIFGKGIDKQMANKGYVLASSVGFARDLGNHPANILTPTKIAKHCQRLAKTGKMKCKIIDVKDFEKIGLGSFYGVARGAKEPAKMILVEYKGGKKSQKPIALVGKGLTFDSGGISLKPGASMYEMKFDMCGSALVLGVLNAVSVLQPKVNIVFAIGSTENMPGSDAQRPGDIVTAYNGKTIEVLNTVAEGRLVLADVLSYTAKKYKPSSMIDFATLTGAVLVALGNRASGVMGNDTKLMNMVKKSSDNTSEKVWELPLWEEYSREIKGKYADIQNLGASRLAGTIAGGVFLKEFVDDIPWVHMDIAGTAWGPNEPEYQPKIGATGVGVRLVYDLLENYIK